MTAQDNVRNARLIPGFMASDRQAEFMYNLALASTSAAELGAYYGLSSAIVGLGMKDRGKYYCIDHWSELKEQSSPDNSCEHTKIQWQTNMTDFGLRDTCVEVRGWSYDQQTLDAVPGNLDFMYFDGDHQTRGTLERDLPLWIPKVKPGGLILIHDYTWPWVAEQVAKVIDSGLLEFVNAIDDFAICRRPLS